MRDDGRMIAVEFDGAYWHSDQDRDIRKTVALTALGWCVIRIRQHPLPLLSLNDVACPASMTPAQTADTVAAVGG